MQPTAFYLDPESDQQEGIQISSYKPWQKFVVGYVIGFEREVTGIALLNGYGVLIKLPSKYLCLWL
jgi:phage terminase large subunit-like protein